MHSAAESKWERIYGVLKSSGVWEVEGAKNLKLFEFRRLF
jgi:hypothetical protein